MKQEIKNLVSDTRGNFVEYIILVGLVALLCIGGYQAFGDAVSAKITEQAGSVSGINGAGN